MFQIVAHEREVIFSGLLIGLVDAFDRVEDARLGAGFICDGLGEFWAGKCFEKYDANVVLFYQVCEIGKMLTGRFFLGRDTTDGYGIKSIACGKIGECVVVCDDRAACALSKCGAVLAVELAEFCCFCVSIAYVYCCVFFISAGKKIADRFNFGDRGDGVEPDMWVVG